MTVWWARYKCKCKTLFATFKLPSFWWLNTHYQYELVFRITKIRLSTFHQHLLKCCWYRVSFISRRGRGWWKLLPVLMIGWYILFSSIIHNWLGASVGLFANLATDKETEVGKNWFKFRKSRLNFWKMLKISIKKTSKILYKFSQNY